MKPTARQLELIQVIANGLNRKKAADALGITHHSANDQLKKALPRLGVHSIEHAVAECLRKGWIT